MITTRHVSKMKEKTGILNSRCVSYKKIYKLCIQPICFLIRVQSKKEKNDSKLAYIVVQFLFKNSALE